MTIAITALFAFSNILTPTAEAQVLGQPAPNQMLRIHNGFYLYWYESSGADGYDIQYRAHDGTTWGQWGTTIEHTGSQPAVLTGLTNGTRYQWRIRGTKNGVDPSEWSNHADATDVAYTREARSNGAGNPNPPPNPTVTAGPASLTVTWKEPHTITGVTVTGYRIEYRYDVNGNEQTGQTGNLPATPRSYTLENLTPGTEYEVWLRAIAGTSLSRTSGATAGTPPPASSGITLTITPTGATRVYGETDNLGYTVGGLTDNDAAGDVVTGALARAPGNDAGTYTINMGTLAIATRYTEKYVLPSAPASTTYTITQREITAISGVTVNTRQADGTTAATFDTSNAMGTGVLAAELPGFRGGLVVSGAFPSASPGTHNVSVTYSLQDHGTFKTGNYSLSATTATLSGEITRKSVTYTSTMADKIYDGTTAAPSELGGSFTPPLIGNDNVTVTGGTYDSADAGTPRAITGATVGGDAAGNYDVTVGTITGTISRKSITAISGVTVNTRRRDGTRTATFDTSRAQGTGVLASELSDFRAGGLVVSGAFPSASPGTHDVSVTYSLRDRGSFKAANYSLSATAATLRGTISAPPTPVPPTSVPPTPVPPGSTDPEPDPPTSTPTPTPTPTPSPTPTPVPATPTPTPSPLPTSRPATPTPTPSPLPTPGPATPTPTPSPSPTPVPATPTPTPSPSPTPGPATPTPTTLPTPVPIPTAAPLATVAAAPTLAPLARPQLPRTDLGVVYRVQDTLDRVTAATRERLTLIIAIAIALVVSGLAYAYLIARRR